MGQSNFINVGLGGGGGDLSAAYLLVSGSDPQGSLTAYRTLVAGAGMQLVDGGALGTLTLVSTASQGPAGPSGSQGPAGQNGTNGTNGTNGAPGTIFGAGGIVQVAGNTVVTQASVLFVSTSQGSINITLATPVGSGTVIAKDIQGSASVNPFTVYPTAGAKIDGVSASYTHYVNFGALKLLTDGKDWFTW